MELEHYIGLYQVVDATCSHSESEYNPCQGTYFVEIVKGQFIDVSDAELAYVFWHGDPEIAPELQYSSSKLEANIEGDKIWISQGPELSEYFLLEDGQLAAYFSEYQVGSSGIKKTIRYKLMPVIRSNLPGFRLNYPGNK
ncbi:hypothetical protein GCM10009092_40150 [Bowmanella denitrificans]|uniref:Uncharacterized protein n=1 Tax=Bowmanella denitrificans TaxID=366582 RepID=A0ABN0XSK2_9ALTE